MSRSRGRTVIPAPVSGTGQALSRNPERFAAGQVIFPCHFWIPAEAEMTVGARNGPLTLNSYARAPVLDAFLYCNYPLGAFSQKSPY